MRAKFVKIKLGKLPDTRNVKLNIVLSAELKAQVDRYAQFYSQTWEHKVDATGLIPHIVSQFLANDRAFRKREHAVKLPPMLCDKN